MTNSASSNMKLVPWMHETQIITYVLVAGSLKEFIPGYKFFMKTHTTFQFLSTNHLWHLFQLYINCLFFCVFHRFKLHIFTWSTIDKCFLMYTPSAAFVCRLFCTLLSFWNWIVKYGYYCYMIHKNNVLWFYKWWIRNKK